MKRRTIMGPLLGMIACAFLAGPASAQYCWTVAGSTATVDEGDLGEVSLANSNLQINSAISSATVTARYSVTGINDLGDSFRYKYVYVRFRDTGDGKVKFALKQQHRSSSTPTDIFTFDSDSWAPNGGFQYAEWWGNCTLGGGFSFFDYLYFIEVDMSKSVAAGNPGVQFIQVCSSPCN